MASRSTFREPARDVAWQKQLRDRHAERGVPNVPHLSVKRAIVKPISRRMAEQIILQYEWLGTMANSNHHFGIFFGPYCAGVTCFGVGAGGANINAHMEWGIERDELAYLTRGANVHWSPTGANSKLVAWSLRLLKPLGVKLAIAYSDTDAGEIGTIYQAANWTCVGRGRSTRQWIAPNGRVYDKKYASDLRERKGRTRAYWVKRLRDAGWKEQASNPKYRYVYVIDTTDTELVRRVKAKRTPYPKRASEAGHSPPG